MKKLLLIVTLAVITLTGCDKKAEPAIEVTGYVETKASGTSKAEKGTDAMTEEEFKEWDEWHRERVREETYESWLEVYPTIAEFEEWNDWNYEKNIKMGCSPEEAARVYDNNIKFYREATEWYESKTFKSTEEPEVVEEVKEEWAPVYTDEVMQEINFIISQDLVGEQLRLSGYEGICEFVGSNEYIECDGISITVIDDNWFVVNCLG